MGMENEQTDEELIRAYLDGNADAFDALYERYKRPLYAYLNKMLGSRPLADDVFQQVWLRIIRSLGAYEGRRKFFSWASMIAHNLAIDQFRRTKKSAEVSLDDEETTPCEPVSHAEPWRDMHNRELAKALQSAADSLADDQKEVFLLRQEGLSFKEIAEVQKCSINTVLGRMQYALRNLIKQLAEWVS